MDGIPEDGNATVSTSHLEPLPLKGDKYGKPLFVGAHDEPNDAYWTLRTSTPSIICKFPESKGVGSSLMVYWHSQQQFKAQALIRVRPPLDWELPNQVEISHLFVLASVDFEADVNRKVQQVGIATLDSADLVVDMGVIAASE
jgi:hypothetical protein